MDEVKEIFLQASELSAPQRGDFLDARCGADSDIRRAVDELLAAHDSAAGFLDGPTLGANGGLSAAIPAALRQLGRYKLLQVIGEGGFGTVYLAEQQSPVRRRVALKIIKAGMDTGQVIARFEAERQALAMMEHPNIARVFDAGATETGRPYFVMELVTGVPVTEYCDANKLTARQRLDLFIPICQAVQHAHQKGIIHRDLKPSNVLITLHDGKPVPKVIDFGIAKATQVRLTDRTLFTEFKQMIGTPEYMSPEQAEMSGLDVDTRSDIYSLGVLLYELLTGGPPFDAQELRSKAYGEMRRYICEVDPPRPSTKLSTRHALASIAAQRGTDPTRLGATLRNDLDWIVMKCLEKERARRYQSASDLALDVQRYLNNEPVTAVPPSAGYRIRKFVSKHKGPVVASAIVLFVLVAGIIGTTVGLIGRERQRRIAEQQRLVAEQNAAEATRQAAVAQAVSRFQSDMLASADPFNFQGGKVTVLQAIQAAVKELDAGKLKDQPLVEASVRHTVAVALKGLARYDEADAQLSAALELRRRYLSADDPQLALTINDQGAIRDAQGRPIEAEKLFRQALEIRRKTLPANDPAIAESLHNLGRALTAQLRFEEAEPLYRESIAIKRKSLPPDHPDTATSLAQLAELLVQRGKLKQAEAMVREALEMRRRCLPAGHPSIANALSALAVILYTQGRIPEAESTAREALQIYRNTLPPQHPQLATSCQQLGIYLQDQGKLSEAEPFLREAAEIRHAVLLSLQGSATQPTSATTRESAALSGVRAGYADILNSLGRLYHLQGKLNEAEKTLREALSIHRQRTDVADAQIAVVCNNLALLLNQQQKHEEAEAMFRESLALRRRAFPAGHLSIARAEFNLAAMLSDHGKPSEAEPLFADALAAYEKIVGKDSLELATLRMYYARLLIAQNRHAEAELMLLAAERTTRNAGTPPATRRDALSNLVTLYEKWAAAEPGKEHEVQAARWKAQMSSPHPATARSAG
jgi:serine/threonine protein kinase/uncharacterized protein HemY